MVGIGIRSFSGTVKLKLTCDRREIFPGSFGLSQSKSESLKKFLLKVDETLGASVANGNLLE